MRSVDPKPRNNNQPRASPTRDAEPFFLVVWVAVHCTSTVWLVVVLVTPEVVDVEPTKVEPEVEAEVEVEDEVGSTVKVEDELETSRTARVDGH